MTYTTSLRCVLPIGKFLLVTQAQVGGSAAPPGQVMLQLMNRAEMRQLKAQNRMIMQMLQQLTTTVKSFEQNMQKHFEMTKELTVRMVSSIDVWV